MAGGWRGRWWDGGRLAAGLLGLVALVLTVGLHLRHPHALITMLPSTDMVDLHLDFHSFWHSALALAQGTDIYATPARLTNLNPPLLTVVLAPIALLDALTAYRVFTAISVVLVLGALLVLARELRLRPITTALVVAAVAVSAPLHATLSYGQIYPLLLVGLVAGWVAQRRGHPVAAAVLYGLMVALKPLLAPILLVALVQRRWRPGLAGILAAVSATAAGLLVAGPSSGWAWLRIVLTEAVPNTVGNASLPALAVRFGLPALLGILVGALLLVATLAGCARRRDPAGTAIWAVLAAALLASPIGWHTYLLLLVPGLMVVLDGRRSPGASAVLAVSAIPVSWHALWPAEGLAGAVTGSLNCAILIGFWLVLLGGRGLPDDGDGRRRDEPDRQRGSPSLRAQAGQAP